jgi:type IV fimbrial biogenesis protein FimT
MKAQTGFTLAEMLTVIAIVGILMGIGVPSYRYITNSYRLSAEVNGLLGDVQFARGEAIKEGVPVTLCVSRDSQTCDAGSTTFQEGWIVFSDPNNNATVDPGEVVLRVQKAFTGTVPDTFVADNNVSSMTFNREGFATAAAGFPNLTITLHDSTSNAVWTKCLWVTPVGMATTETPAHNISGTCN